MIQHCLVVVIISLFTLLSTSSQAYAMPQQSFNAGAADQYVVANLAQRQLRPSDIEAPLQALAKSPWLTQQLIGRSFEGRPIYRLTVGRGETVVLMWTQMHGDESTATAAVFDLLRRVEQDEAWRDTWINELTVHIIPMLNPDGAERGQRESAQGIDINRDAQALQTPEARLLRAQAEQLKPAFAFNLHDQNDYYAVGRSAHPATISVLAPAYDVAKSVNPSRQRAMQVIASMMQVMDTYLPDHTGRYSDSYEWRAFGDLFSAFGISTILIESGAYFNDPDRQVARALNRALLAHALTAIAAQSYRQAEVERYWQIPMNRSNGFHDLIIEQVTVNAMDTAYQVDLAIRRSRDGQRSQLESVGDQTGVHAFERFAASGLRYQSGQPYAIPTAGLQLDHAQYQALLQQGYSHFVGAAEQLQVSTSWPVVVNPEAPATVVPQVDHNATFLLAQDQQVTYAVLQGRLFALSDADEKQR